MFSNVSYERKIHVKKSGMWPPNMKKSILYTRKQCAGGGGSGPQTDKHLPQSPFTDKFF